MPEAYGCCEHCDGSGFHPTGRDEHRAPCPDGCNGGGVTETQTGSQADA